MAGCRRVPGQILRPVLSAVVSLFCIFTECLSACHEPLSSRCSVGCVMAEATRGGGTLMVNTHSIVSINNLNPYSLELSRHSRQHHSSSLTLWTSTRTVSITNGTGSQEVISPVF